MHGEMIHLTNFKVVTTLGVRAVLVAGWTTITPEMKVSLSVFVCFLFIVMQAQLGNVFVDNSVPHDWLMPRCSVIVHHGGVGTIAAA